MKNRFLAAICALLVMTGVCGAQQIITATVTVTNTAGTTNGETITVNGQVRTFTNVITSSSSQVLLGTNITIAASNLWFSYVVSVPANLTVATNSTNAILLKSFPGQALTVSISTNWGTLTYTTNTLTPFWPLRLPLETAEGNAMQTNLASAAVRAIDSSAATNALHESSPAVQNLIGVTNSQTITGQKIFSSLTGRWGGIVSNSPGIGGAVTFETNGYWTNAVLDRPSFTNAVNFGSAFSSPGTGGSAAEQFGSNAVASGASSLAVGGNSTASAGSSMALGYSSAATNSNAIAIGNGAKGWGSSSIAIGVAAHAISNFSTAIGFGASAGNSNSTAVGFSAVTTADNQIMLGSSGISVVVNNALQVGTGATFGNGITNLQLTGTNILPAGADISFGRYALSTLANGINQDIIVGTNVFVEVSGPSGAFSIEGIAGGRDGKFLIIWNATGQNMTIAVEGGATGNDPTAANRILSGTGADRATTGNGSAMLIYSGSAARWILLSLDP